MRCRKYNTPSSRLMLILHFRCITMTQERSIVWHCITHFSRNSTLRMTTYDYDVGVSDVPGRSSLGSSGSSGYSATRTLTLRSRAQPNVSYSTFYPQAAQAVVAETIAGSLFVCLFSHHWFVRPPPGWGLSLPRAG